MHPVDEIRQNKGNQDEVHHAPEQIQKHDEQNEYHASFDGGKLQHFFE
ncbi:hypothetical protein J2TS6_12520 [Paenibacillus albilobatus]|uniref:Uncharacterized protein n=1 Tax=Paenibacillus albilobatus TaxID=2716884 RepID=A0A919XCE5_9BACL|nr:hypothetical protein J2TS6_12520 [Paenibacillus albilobatus]